MITPPADHGTASLSRPVGHRPEPRVRASRRRSAAMSRLPASPPDLVRRRWKGPGLDAGDLRCRRAHPGGPPEPGGHRGVSIGPGSGAATPDRTGRAGPAAGAGRRGVAPRCCADGPDERTARGQPVAGRAHCSGTRGAAQRPDSSLPGFPDGERCPRGRCRPIVARSALSTAVAARTSIAQCHRDFRPYGEIIRCAAMVVGEGSDWMARSSDPGRAPCISKRCTSGGALPSLLR